MKKQQVPLELIVTDAGTQQHPIDPDLRDEYYQLRKDGVELTPVELTRAGSKYYLTDGFHRYEVETLLESKYIYAYVTEGTLSDAIWASFGANREHGYRRKRGIVKEIIEKILCDKKWSKISQAKIARHVGVSKPYVSMVKSDILAKQKQKPDSEAEKGEKGLSNIIPLERSDEIEVESSTGKTYVQKSQGKETKPPKPITDRVKQIVPDNLRDLYESRKEILSVMNKFEKLNQTILDAVDKRNPAFTFMNTNQIKSIYKNYRRTLRSALFYAVCPYCAGKGGSCKSCAGVGLLNELKYASVIKELKAKK